MKPFAEWKLWAALTFGLVIGLVNVAKPVHVDDALYLNIARRIVTHPLDPFGGILNWQQIPEPTYNVSISPPLLSYWFATVMIVAGENVPLLHLSMIPWLLLACWGVFRLGERWANAGLLTVLLVIGGPAVVVGMNLMLDVPLLACMCASVEFLARTETTRTPLRTLVFSSAFAALGVGIKMPALALVPVFLVASLTTRRWGPLLAALGPLITLVCWQMISKSIYGTSQVNAGLSFLSKLQTSLLPQTIERTLTMMAILATTFPLWLATRWTGRRAMVQAIIAGLATATAAWLIRSIPMNRLAEVTPAFLVAVFLGTCSISAIVWPGRRWTLSGFDPRLWLAAWIASGAAVVILFGPFVAVRSFLPIHPPLAIWLIGSFDPLRPRRPALWLTVTVTLILSIELAATDMRWSRCYPQAVREIATRFGGANRPIDFLGHWGWQYYAEHAGFRSWDARRTDAPSGTILVIPFRADKQWINPAVLSRFRPVDQIVIPRSSLRLTTWNRDAGFRFYGGEFGQLPWGFSNEPTERFSIFEIGPQMGFSDRP